MKFVVATEISTLILWWRASLLASPTVFPASIVPWRCIAPVRARIASSNVVLPLWNGPTSAMHRGPVARVPFCAISASQIRRDAAFCETVSAIVSGRRGIWQEASAPQARARNPLTYRGQHAARKRPPPSGGRSNDRNDAARSGAGAQPKFRDADRMIESDRAVHRDRLQRHGAVGAADEDIGAEAGSDGHLAACAEIVAGEKAGIGADAVREHAPYHDAAAGDADVEAELADRSAIDLLRAGRLRSVHAGHRFLRSDDETDAR